MSKVFLRRRAAGQYLKDKYDNWGEKTLAKLASVGGGPPFRKCGVTCLYEPDELDKWALSKISAPQASTSQKAA